ncbi:EamA family transporter [Actinomycetes bacterium KLBMP 9759]
MAAVPVSPAPATTTPDGQLGPVAFVLAGQLVLHAGAAVATFLIPLVGGPAAVALRLGLSAVVLLAVCRPRLRGRTHADWAVVVGFGATLAGMNMLFYEAIARMPLGAAVTVEVLGPLALSVLTARGAGRWVWPAVALAGVALLGWDGLGGLTIVGGGFALAAGALWAAYILLAQRTGGRFERFDGLALAMGAATVLSAPVGIATAGTALLSPAVLGLGAAVALMSSMVPYGFELVALRRLRAATFAILMSLSPALAAVTGFVLLGQRLSVLECLAVVLVVVASVGAVRGARRPVAPAAA